MGIKKREFAVLNKAANQWFITPTLLELSALANKAMQFTAFPADTKTFYIAEIQNGVFLNQQGETISKGQLSESNLIGAVLGYNIVTGETQYFESVLVASKYTGITYSAAQYRACVHPVAPWPTKNWCFKWASDSSDWRKFTAVEIETFTDVDNICIPIKLRNSNSDSYRSLIAPTIASGAKVVGCATSTAANALKNANGRVGEYQLWYLK